MNTKFNRTQAWVLRRTNYGEADRILNLITPSGQIACLARGVRRNKSKLAASIELFCLFDAILLEAKHNAQLKILSSASLVRQLDCIIKDYDRLMFAYEVLRQVERASRELGQNQFFDLTSQVLFALNQPEFNFDLIRAWFYLRISKEMGEELNLISDDKGEQIRAGCNYRYDYESKSLYLDQSAKISTDHIKLLRLMMSANLILCSQVVGHETLLSVILPLCQAHAGLN